MTVAATLLGGRYSLDEEIGTGGFCEVWRAADTVLRRPVAVKLLHAGHADQPEIRARFKAEARHAAALSHENIARVYDYGEPACGRSYLVMELIAGPSLTSVLAGGPLGAARTMDVVAQVAAGLQAAHSAGLIHRDVKPSNILFTADGRVRITDFGISHAVGSAPLTATGMMMGSPGYIAPERLAGARAGPASDLYALGIVAFECLAGGQPFSGPPLEVAIAHRDRPLPPLPTWLPAEVTDFVMVLTAKDPAWRPASADEVACQARRLRDRLVSGAIGPRPVPADAPLTITDAPPSPARGAVRDRTRAGRSRRPLTLGAAAVVMLAALASLILITATRFGPASHPVARPSPGRLHVAPLMTKPPSTAPLVAAHPADQQPSAAPNATTPAVATVGQTPAWHHTPLPGPHHHKNHPVSGHGSRPGQRPNPGHGPGNDLEPGPGNNQAVVLAAGCQPVVAAC